ncbi:MAG: hypothetical protein AABW47_00800 [Nanoarchaeota archaeon]
MTNEIKNKDELNEWTGIELVLVVDRKIEWKHIFGKIKQIGLDYWFIGNPNQHSQPIKLLTAKIENWDGESLWMQDKLKGEGDYDGDVVEYLTYKEVKEKPCFSEGQMAMEVIIN